MNGGSTKRIFPHEREDIDWFCQYNDRIPKWRTKTNNKNGRKHGCFYCVKLFSKLLCLGVLICSVTLFRNTRMCVKLTEHPVYLTVRKCRQKKCWRSFSRKRLTGWIQIRRHFRRQLCVCVDDNVVSAPENRFCFGIRIMLLKTKSVINMAL